MAAFAGVYDNYHQQTMATTINSRPRTIKKLEKPRPLKISQRAPVTQTDRITTIDDIVSLIDNVAMHLNNGFFDQLLQSNVVTMCNHLKLYSRQLESYYKDQLDRAFIAIRNGSQDERLDMTTRIYLLELIELRAKQWEHNASMNAYYSQKLSNIVDNQIELLTPETPTNLLTPVLTPSSTSPPLLGPGEVIRDSGKFAKPTRIQGKNYCKDEIVIRNSDSGKVNPGAKERLVQITGTSEDKINYAKDLIKDTIQRNASPVRLDQGVREKSAIGGSSSSLNSSASDESNKLQQHSSLRSSLLHSLSTNDASIGEYKYTVTVGPHSLKITGCNLDLVRAAKLALDEYFSEESEHIGSGVEYFTFDEESVCTPVTPTTPQTPLSAGQTNFLRRNLSQDTNKSVDIVKQREVPIPEIEPRKYDSARELSYEFLMQCAKGPFARRPPADWDIIQKECPSIIRKVQTVDKTPMELATGDDCLTNRKVLKVIDNVPNTYKIESKSQSQSCINIHSTNEHRLTKPHDQIVFDGYSNNSDNSSIDDNFFIPSYLEHDLRENDHEQTINGVDNNENFYASHYSVQQNKVERCGTTNRRPLIDINRFQKLIRLA